MLIIATFAAVLYGGAGTAPATPANSPDTGRVTSPSAIAAIVARASALATSRASALVAVGSRVPSFSRQTKLACGACHYGFPALTPLGRLFKLNGYTLTGLTPITWQADSTSRVALTLSPIAPLSVMAIASATNMATALPGAQGTTAQFPQQLSLFAASSISSKMGIFSQFTYEDQSATFGIDNVDVRFATHKMIKDHDVILGLTLNNNPTVQDVWNTTPAWGYPFTSSAVAPTPAAATLIDGGLAQSVMGIGAYSLYNNWLYAELSGYVSAPQGVTLPLDSTATNTARSVSPYWRVAVQHDFASSYLMVGTFGIHSQIYPTGVTGETNRYSDIGVDAQFEHPLEKGAIIGRASYIHERQNLLASAAVGASQNSTNSLNSYKFNVSYIPNTTHSLSVGVFGTSGSSDNVLYAPSPVTGSSSASPASQGTIIEYNVNPFLNVRLGAQYIMYQKFNGASNNYDLTPNGRSAKNNNSLYVYLWLAY